MCQWMHLEWGWGGHSSGRGKPVHNGCESQSVNPGEHEMSLFSSQPHFCFETPFHWGVVPFPQGRCRVAGAGIMPSRGWGVGVGLRNRSSFPLPRLVPEHQLHAEPLSPICCLPCGIFPVSMDGRGGPRWGREVPGVKETQLIFNS